MVSITERAIPAIYKLAKQVYEKEGSDKKVITEAIEDAVDILVNVNHMNKASATMYINFFRCMMRGEVHKRSINKTCVRYYCENVLRDYRVEQLKIFLEGLEEHIKYNKNRGFEVPSLCDIHNEYSDKAGMPPKFN